jgi:hypothetical protein
MSVSGNGRIVEVSLEELQELKNNAVPENTRKATSFAVNLYNIWCTERGTPPLECGESHLLAASIPKFCAEIRNKHGDPYKSTTMANIYAGLNRYLQQEIDASII